MASQVTNRTVNIFIESGNAQKALDALIKKENQLKDALAKATDPKQIARITDELNKLSEPLDRAKKKLSGELNPSFKDIQKTVNDLGNRLRLMSEQDADFSTVLSQYKQASKELEAQRGKVGLLQRAMRSFWQEVKTVAVGVVIGNTIQTALQSVLGYVTGIVSGSAKISDELADIQRVTGLTKEEVKGVNSELKKIDTRTGVSALREIVIVAGKLGISKQEVVGFTKAVDQLNVALGGELGDINTFTSDLGKILNVFEGKITGDNVSKLGNAIVDLANKGVASGPFLVDFSQRVAGIAKTSNLSLGAVLGLAAGLEESGQKVESSSTAISKLLVTIAEDVPKAAKIANVEVQEFTELFAKTPEKALLLFAQGLQKNKSSFSEIAAGFKDAGEEGARVISTLSTLGQKTEFFKRKIDDATASLKNTNVIQEAFRLKNETAGAALDKFSKNFASLFTSRTFQEVGESVIRVLNTFVDVLKGIPEFVEKNRFALLTLAAGILLVNRAYIQAGASAVFFRTMQVLETVVLKAATVARHIATASQLAYSVAIQLVTGRMGAAAAAQRLLNLVMAAGLGPIGAVLITIGGLVIAFKNLFTHTKELTAAEKLRQEVTAKTKELLGDQVAQITVLLNVARDERAELGKRKQAIEDLIKINPAFAETLKINAQGHLEGAQGVAEYIKQLQLLTEAEASRIILIDKTKQKIETFNKIKLDFNLGNISDEDLEKIVRKVADTKTNALSDIDEIINKQTAKSITGLLDQINILQADIGRSHEKSKESIEDLGKSSTKETAAVITTIAALKKQIKDLDDAFDTLNKDDLKAIATNRDQRKKLQDELDKLEGKTTAAGKKTENDLKKLIEDLKKIRLELQLATLGDFEKALGEQDAKYAALRERAKNNGKLLTEIEELHSIARLQLIQEFARREVDLWSKKKDEVNKIADEKLKRNVQKLREFTERFTEEFNKDAAHEVERHDRNRLAGDELAVLKANGRKKLQAQLELLKEQERQELQQKDLTENEKLLIEEKYRRKRLDAEIAFISQILDFAQQALNINNIFANARTEKENQELESDRRRNDRKKQNLESRLKAGIITQLNYQREIDKLNKDQEKKEKDARLRQFQRDKRAQLVQAGISGAQAVLTTLEKFGPPIPPNFLGIVAMAFTAAATIANVATIASKKAPEFARGGLLGGQLHSRGGNPVIDNKTGKPIANIEKGEGIVNRHSMADNRKYTVTGTTSQITSVLNSIKGGVHWQPGATIEKHKEEKIIKVLEKGASRETTITKLLGAPVMPNVISIAANNIVTNSTMAKAAKIAGKKTKEFASGGLFGNTNDNSKTSNTSVAADNRKYSTSASSRITGILNAVKEDVHWYPDAGVSHSQKDKVIHVLDKGTAKETKFIKLLGAPVSPNVVSIVANNIITNNTIAKAAAVANQTKKDFVAGTNRIVPPAKTGTTSQITNILNSVKDGVHWEPGATIEKDHQEKIVHILERGAAKEIRMTKLLGTPAIPNIISIVTNNFNTNNTIAKAAAVANQTKIDFVAGTSKTLPPAKKQFARGGMLGGQLHSEGGNPIIDGGTGKPIANIEKGEGIVNRHSMADDRSYTVTGTTSQITSILNSIGGGVHWHTGAVIRPAWSTQRPQQINYEAINTSINTVRRYYATGGTFDAPAPQPANATDGFDSTQMMKVLMQMVETNENLNNTLSTIRQKGIKSYPVLSELEAKRKQLEDIKDDATMR